MTHTRWEELAAGHALSALEPEDEHDFLRHLAGCDLCGRTLTELRGVVGELAYAAGPAEPPRSVLAAIREGVGAGDRPVLAPARRLSRRPVVSRRWLLTAAVAVVVLVLGLWNAVLRTESRRKDEVIALRARFEEMLADPASEKVELSGRGAGLAVVRGTRVMLLLDGLPVSDPGPAVYVLWARDTTGRLVAVQGFEIGNPGRPNLIPPMSFPSFKVKGLVVSREPSPVLPAAPAAELLSGVPG